MSGSREVSGVTGDQSVVVTGGLALGRDVYGGLGGGTYGWGVGDLQDGDRDILNRWEDTVANIIIGTEPNDPLVYAPGLEIYHLIMSMLGGHGDRLER